MNDIQKNKVRAIVAIGLRAVAMLCTTGTIMQTFLASLGFSSQFIFCNTTIVQASNVMTIFLCSQWADSSNVIKRSAITEIPHAILYLCYIPLCIWKSASLAAFIALTVICLLQSICIALYTVCEYKLPYVIYRPKDYGAVLAISGIISSLLSLGTGILISKLTTVLSYPNLMLISCAVSALLMLFSAFLHYTQKPIAEEFLSAPRKMQVNQHKIPFSEIFRYPVFSQLIPANLFRGFSTGATGVMAAIAIDLGYDEGVSTALVAVQSVATLIGYLFFGALSSKIQARIIILIGSLFFLFIPLMLIGNQNLFLTVFAAIFIGRTLVDSAIPSALRFTVPVEIAGPYNAWRMILHNGGMLIATAIAVFIPVRALLIITAVLQIISGIGYFSINEFRAAKNINTNS